MEQFQRFGIDFDKDEFVETSIYGLTSVFLLVEKRIENYLKQYNLSSSKFNMMMIIKHHGKNAGISQVDISKRLIVTASNMTKQLDKLIAEGMVERFAQKGDRRVNLIKITKQGSDLLDKVWLGYVNIVKEITSDISLNERKALSQILAKWFDALENNRT
jgi:DNA-binding MarR family transcriptional regulator